MGMVGRRRKRTEEVANWAKKLRTKSRVKIFWVIAGASEYYYLILLKAACKVPGLLGSVRCQVPFSLHRHNAIRNRNPLFLKKGRKGGFNLNKK
jgi:hypothetical protein